MASDNTDDFTTKTRVCPSCRETINVLAVKCRYCGEDVGRPKDAARELSIHDLGGETIHHAAPSGSVMEALEVYRAEEGKSEEGEALGPDDLPKLDSKNQDLASITFDRPGSTAYKPPQPSAGDRFKTTLKVVAVLAVVILIAVKGVPWIIDYVEARGAVPKIERPNRALNYLDNGTKEEALTEAVAAVDFEDSVKNRQILEQVLDAIKAETNTLLNKAPWDEANLSKASQLAAMAAITWPSDDDLFALNMKVKEEMRAYCMILKGVSTDTASIVSCDQPDKHVTIYAEKVETNADGKEVVTQEASTFAGRFKVDRIYAKTVVFKDMLRNNRSYTITRGG